LTNKASQKKNPLGRTEEGEDNVDDKCKSKELGISRNAELVDSIL